MIKSVNHLCEHYLELPKKELLKLSKETSKYYSEFIKKQVKSDGTIKLRPITEAKGQLKVVQKRILKNILAKIEYSSPPYVGGLKKKDNILNAYFHQGKPYKFCTDLKNFFPHINNQMVYSAFVNQGFSADVSSILTRLTTHKGKLIQGGVNSTHIAYLAIWNTVKALSKICNENEIVFTIYVDDMTFSSHWDFKELSIKLRDIVIDGGFFINHKKTFFTKGKAEITGTLVGQNSLNVKTDFRKKLNNAGGLTELQKIGLEMYYERVVTYGKDY